MNTVSTRARIVSASLALLTSTMIIGGTVVGLTSGADPQAAVALQSAAATMVQS
jgi:hypothetical protein